LGLQAVGMDGSPLFQLQRSADRWPCLNATTFTASESAIASTGTRNVSTISPAASMTNSASIALSGNLYSQLRELERLRDQSGNAPNAWTVIDADPAAILGALFPHEY
jgi:hypothetical protein